MKSNSDYEYVNNHIHLKHNAFKKIGTLNEKINDICKTIEDCSCFDSEQINPVICDLITLFEGEKFVYQSANYYSNNKESKLECIKIIALNDKKQDKVYCERYVNSLVKKGNAIVLTKTETIYPHLIYCIKLRVSFGL